MYTADAFEESKMYLYVRGLLLTLPYFPLKRKKRNTSSVESPRASFLNQAGPGFFFPCSMMIIYCKLSYHTIIERGSIADDARLGVATTSKLIV